MTVGRYSRAPPRGVETNSPSPQTNTQKKEKRHFFLFSLMSIRMEVKPPRFIPNNTQKKEKSHFFLFSLISIRMEVNVAQFYKRCALKYCAAEGRNRRQHGASIRAPENRSAARFLGKRSGRRSGQDGKHSAPSAMAPWRDERMAGFPLPHGKFFCQL